MERLKRNILLFFSLLCAAAVFCQPDTIQLKRLDSTGFAFEKRSQYDSALKYYSYLLGEWTKTGRKEKIALYFLKTGRIKAAKGNMEGAISDYFKMLGYATETGDHNKQMIALTRIGRCYENLGNDARALEIYRRAFSLGESYGNKVQMVYVCNSIATIFLKQRNFDSTKKYLDEGAELANSGKDPNNLYVIANGYGIYHLASGNPRRAVNDFNQALSIIVKTFPGSDFEAGIYINLGSAYIAMNQLTQAEQFLQKALYLSQQNGHPQNISEAYQNFSELYARKKDFKKAYDYASLYSAVNDSIATGESNRKLAEMQAVFEVKQKEAQLAKLRAGEIAGRYKLEMRNTEFLRWTIFLSLIAVVFIFSAWLALRMRKINIKLAAQKLALETQQEEIRQQHFRLSRLQAQMNPHFIFNSLNSLQHLLVKGDRSGFSARLDRFSSLMQLHYEEAESTLVTIAHELRFLENYLELEKLRFSNAFAFSFSVSPELKQEQLLLPPMLIQPFLENSINHGLLPKKDGAGKISVSFSEDSSCLKICIEDNGIGRAAAEKNKTQRSAHISRGMDITRERIALCWQSQHGQPAKTFGISDLITPGGEAAGTRVTLWLPFINNL